MPGWIPWPHGPGHFTVSNTGHVQVTGISPLSTLQDAFLDCDGADGHKSVGSPVASKGRVVQYTDKGGENGGKDFVDF